MASATVEDYVKAIYTLERESPTGEAAGARIAAVLGVTKGSVTSMVRKLRTAELAEAEPYGGIRLTERGRALALDVLRRHRILEVFLVEVLGFDWSDVHDEAERLEHAMSARLLDRLDAYLGHPAFDPHGDPIPDAEGRIVEPEGQPLPTLGCGEPGTVIRIADQEPEFLDFVRRHGLLPGARFTVREVVPEAESITLAAEGYDPVPLALSAAEKLLVEPGHRGPDSAAPTRAQHAPTPMFTSAHEPPDAAAVLAEDVLRAVLELSGRGGTCPTARIVEDVDGGDLDTERTVARLVREGSLSEEDGRTLSLTDVGRRRAVEIRSRHVEVLRFLTSLGIPRAIAERDAHGIEHCVSPETLRALRGALSARRA